MTNTDSNTTRTADDTPAVTPDEQATARIRASLDICDECGNDLYGTSYAASNAHRESCSLHTDNVYPRNANHPGNTP